jgi:hypothetical protein
MRDRRFVAVHRGGGLELVEHRLLAGWAADCAEHLLERCGAGLDDERLWGAIDMGRAWARGEVRTGAAMRAAVACHAVAREAVSAAATVAARAVGHAVATAHMADHCLGVVLYGKRAIELSGGVFEGERAWQVARLPEAVRELVLTALEERGW